MRNRRSGVEDTWTRRDGTPTKEHGGPRKRWRARYVDSLGKEHSRSFDRKADANAWLDEQTAAIVAGTHVAPRDSRITVAQWCDVWLEAYGVNRDSTVRQARTHITHIKSGLGEAQLAALEHIHIKSWLSKLKADGYKPSYVYALHGRLAQILGDAVASNRLGRNPCTGTAPAAGGQREYMPTTAQVWQLHDALPDHLRVAVLLGAFAGLRVSEAAGLRVADVDFVRGVVFPKVQWGGAPLKTDGSSAPIPVPQELCLMLSASVQKYPSEFMVTNGPGTDRCGPWLLQRAVRDARAELGLPEAMNFHALRHHLASMLIAGGADIKQVQKAMRHAKAATTLDVYGHLWPDADESVRRASSQAFSRALDAPNGIQRGK